MYIHSSHAIPFHIESCEPTIYYIPSHIELPNRS